MEGEITDDCLQCVRKIGGGKEGVCTWDVDSESCGPFQIKESYWKDCKTGRQISLDFGTIEAHYMLS